MNIKKLKQAEESFMDRYPLGFDTPEIQAISKKHRMDKIVAFTKDNFTLSALENVDDAIENSIRLVQRSTMVSLFEKPKFRDGLRSMGLDERTFFIESLKQLLHGDEELGFHQMLDIFINYGLAKWTLITVFRCYYYPETDLLYKPTTVKNVIKYFEIENLIYKPRPSYDFFIRYRDIINDMKKEVNPMVTGIYNAGFSGFLMMAMQMAAEEDEV